MVEATGADSLAALLRRYLAEGLARDALKLEREWSERPVGRPALEWPRTWTPHGENSGF
jgi:hypothetical protein